MAVTRIRTRSTTTSPSGDATMSPELLEQRLIEGERQIALAEARGVDTSRLVDFWIDLLHQYEHAVDTLPQAA